jgi:ssDNA thymidine ADP-ribosyltransferase DarT-like protein
MERERVAELHFITTLDNLDSVLKVGILCRNQAARLPHTSIANEEVQDRRANVQVPGGGPLHDYANLYFDARNAMMFDRRSRSDLIVVRVHHQALDLPGCVVTDGNAASGATAFYPAAAGLRYLDESRVYAESWHRDEDKNAYEPWEKRERRRQRQAEVLVPSGVPVGYIIGCYVRRAAMSAQCSAIKPDLDIRIHKKVFFDV